MVQMNRGKLILILLVGVAIGFAASLYTPQHKPATEGAVVESAEEATQYTCGMHPFVIQDEPGSCPICGMDLTPLKPTGDSATASGGERKIKYWVAPMDPTYVREEPGKSPMGMDLVPVYEDEVPEGSVITVDPVTMQNMGVRTATVDRKELHRTIKTVGLVGYDETKQYSVNSKIGGWVERLYVSITGQKVEKGDPLLAIYSPELVTAQEEYLLALNNLDSARGGSIPSLVESAERLAAAAKRRLSLWDISQADIRKLERERIVNKTLKLYSPYSGVVTMKMALEGQYVKKGMELFQIADLSSVWVYADIYESEIIWVEEGQEANIILPYAGKREIDATVSYIYPYLDPKTRTVKARLNLANTDLDLKPDMFVNVRIHTKPIADALVVPSEAILYNGEKNTVFIALNGGKFEPRRIKIGLKDDEGFTEVTQGLLEGDRVVVSAQFMLDSESKLQEAIQKMLNPKKREQTSAEEDDDDDLFGDDTSDSKEGPAKKENLDDLF